MKRSPINWQSMQRGIAAGAALFLLSMSDQVQAQTVYRYNYSDDGVTNADFINDVSNNPINTDLTNFSFGAFAGTFDYLNPTPAETAQLGLAAGDRIFDVQSTGFGGLTPPSQAPDIYFSNAQIAAAGGFTFETWVKRTSGDFTNQIIWSPNGVHTIELAAFDLDGDFVNETSFLQLAMRSGDGPGATFGRINAATALPVGEWHKLTAVMDVTVSPEATFSLYVDGVLAGPLFSGANPIGPDALNGSLNIDSSGNRRHGIGWNEHGTQGGHFLGQMAKTSLVFGVVPEPASMALAVVSGLAVVALRRRVA